MAAQLSDYDYAHFRDILIGHGDWFSADLLRLIKKADAENKECLRLAFPDHVQAYDDYVNSQGRFAK